jgi:hypothetical protein
MEWPIILTPDGHVADGAHRVFRALAAGKTRIFARRLPEMPKPIDVVTPQDAPRLEKTYFIITKHGFDSLENPQAKQLADYVRERLRQLAVLRQEVDAELARPLAERRAEVLPRWAAQVPASADKPRAKQLGRARSAKRVIDFTFCCLRVG